MGNRKIHVTLAEMRAASDVPTVRCNHVKARTMEILATGIELARIPIPCRVGRYTAKNGPDTWWPTPEPPHRISQICLEPVMFS
jgi:hypothetical protein